MEGLYGFGYAGKRGKGKVSICTPHFGVAEYITAVSLLDNALNSPGMVFGVETYIMKRDGDTVMARLLISATIVTEGDIRFVIGWIFKK